MRPVWRVAAAAATLVTLVSATACSDDDKSQADKPRDKITYLTALGATGRESFAWVAKEKGFFKEAGIDVTIKPGNAGESNIKLLHAGQAQFAIVEFSSQVVRAGTGADPDSRVIGAIHQRTVAAFIAFEGSGINKPADLQGKTIGQSPGAMNKTLFPAYTKLSGIDGSSVKWADAAAPQLPALLVSGKVDAVAQWVPAVPSLEAASKGKKAVVLPFGDFLTDIYGNVLVTDKKIIKENPDLVKRFRGALFKGLKYAIEHPEEAGQILHKDQAAVDAKAAAEELKIMGSYVTTATEKVEIGSMDPTRVAKGIALVQSLGLIQSGLDVNKYMDVELTRQQQKK